jgi:hypothetical protein
MIAPFEAMAAIPFQLLLLMFAGWVNRHQLEVIEYLQEENRVLKEHMGERRLRFRADRRPPSAGYGLLERWASLSRQHCAG